MKIFWIIIGALLAGGLLGAFIFSGVKEHALEKDTSEFVTETATAISDPWNAHSLIERAEPGLIKAMSSQGQSVEELFTVYAKLGALISPPVCTLKDTTQIGGVKEYVTASYACEAQYGNGPATMLITLRKGRDYTDWKVYYLNVSSPSFSEQNYPRTK